MSTAVSGQVRALTLQVAQFVAFAAMAGGVLALLLVVTGHAPGPALSALVRGSVGSTYALSSTIVRAIPLATAGLAAALAFRAGLLNIGAEGQLLMGASVATAVGALIPERSALLAVPLMLGAAMGAGAAWAWIAAELRRRFGVLEVISTIMLNFVALYVTGWLVRGPLQEPTRIYPQSASLPVSQQLPIVFSGTRVHVGVVLVGVVAIGLWWWLRATASGFRLRAVGANAWAAASAGGIRVQRTTLLAFLVSGAIAGLAGGMELTGVTYALYETSPGYGYTAIAVALLARLHPLGVLATALLFGALEAGAGAMQRDAAVPSVVVSVVEAALILLVVAADRWQSTRVSRRSAVTA
ncbi:MAG: ABC transporter permease [Gemmatimonadaceae bacterium]|nr:ABC transporter permease [Gemmatimonadaceae bacterium]